MQIHKDLDTQRKLRESHTFKAQVTLSRIALDFSHKLNAKITNINNKNSYNFNNDIS